MPDPQTTFRSAFWNHAGKTLEYLLMYATSVLIARGLGVQENGTFVGVVSFSQLFLVLVSFGLDVSLNTHLPQLSGAQRDEGMRYIVRRVLAVRVTIILGLVVALYGVVNLSPTLVPRLISEYFWVLLAYTCVRSVVSLFAIVLTAELLTRMTSIIHVLARALELLLIAAMASAGITPMKVLIILTSAAMLQVAAYVIVGRGYLFGKETYRSLGPVIIFGGIYWTNTVVEFLLGRQGDVLLLTMLLPDATEASLYDVAFGVCQLASLSMTLGLGGVTLATFARLAVRSTELLERFYGFMIRMTSLLSIPLYAFILFNAGTVLFVLYSSRFLAAAPLIQGIAAFRIVSRIFGGPENAEFLLSRSRVTTLVTIGIVGAFLNVGLDLLLIPTLGGTGAVIGSGCGNLAVNLLGALAVYRTSSARVQWLFWLKVLAPAAAASFACYLVFRPGSLELIVAQVICYVLLVLALFFFIKPLTAADYEWLSRIESRMASPLRYFARVNTGIVDARAT